MSTQDSTTSFLTGRRFSATPQQRATQTPVSRRSSSETLNLLDDVNSTLDTMRKTQHAVSIQTTRRGSDNKASTGLGKDIQGRGEIGSKPVSIRLPVSPAGLNMAIGGHANDIGQHSIVVQWVTPTGTAGQDGRIKKGDKIVAINGKSLVGVSPEDAAKMLAIARGPANSDADIKRVQLVSSPEHGGFGIILEGGKNPKTFEGGPILIKEILTDSPAESQALEVGMEILSINGHSLRSVTLDKASSMLNIEKVRSMTKLGRGSVTLEVRVGKYVTVTYIPSNRSASNNYSIEDIPPLRQLTKFSSDDLNSPAGVQRLFEEYKSVCTERNKYHQNLVRAMQAQEALEYRIQVNEESRNASRSLEQDYDEIITLLEAEIAHLRAQLVAGPDEKDRLLVDYRRRCLVLGAQVNKAVDAKNIADVAIKTLTSFVRGTRENLMFNNQTVTSSDRRINVDENGRLRHKPFETKLPPQAEWVVGDSCVAPWLDGDGMQHVGVIRSLKADECVVQFTDIQNSPVVRQVLDTIHLRPLKKSVFAVSAVREMDDHGHRAGAAHTNNERSKLSALETTILENADVTIRKVSEILQNEALPFGWEEAITADGARYYINHISQTTSWFHPSTQQLPQEKPLGFLRVGSASGLSHA